MKLLDALRISRAPVPAQVSVVPQPLVSYNIQNALKITPSLPGSQTSTVAWERAVGDPMRFVPHDKATTVSTVWACMDVVAAAIASSDWNVYRGIRGEDRKESLPADRLHYILNTRFNPEMTAQAGKRAMMLSALGWGNGWAEIEFDDARRPIGLWPIDPERATLMRDFDTRRLFLRVTQGWNGGVVDLEMDEVLCIRGPGVLGFAGDDLINKAMRTIVGAIAQDEFQNAYFSNNAQLGTVFTYKSGAMDDTAYQRAKDEIKSKHAGARRAYSAAILTGEWNVQTLGTNAEDAALEQIRNLTVEEICRWFRVPPHKVAHLARATNNNIEHQGLEFSRDTLRPWKVEIEQECDYKLFGERARKFVELDVDWAEQGGYKDRMEAFSKARAMGVFSANDILRKLGENTIGADGDIRIVQGANVRLEDVGAAYGAPAEDPEDDAVKAWLANVYDRVQRRFKNRLADLDRAGRRDALQVAEADALQYAEKELASLKTFTDTEAAMCHVVDLITGAKP